MDILTRYDLEKVGSETDVIGDVDEWLAAYEQGIMAIAWEELRLASERMLAEWRDRFI